MFEKVEDAIKWIENIQRFERRENLNRMHKCLDILGHPEKKYKKVHVAGTNGKGSVVMYIKNILLTKGYNVGCFVSPYVICFNERIQLNNEYISDDDLLYHTNNIYKLWTSMEEQGEIITFFEVLTLICFCYFASKNIEYAVIEVGLGGLLDATNVIDADLSIITNIGYDHMNVLGNTLEEIARNKLGIVKQNNFLISNVNESLLPLFHEHVISEKAKMKWISNSDIIINIEERTHFIYEDKTYELKMIGLHQAYNAVLAIEAVKYLEPNISIDIVRKGLYDTFWPGRMELVLDKPHVIIDGAHNIHGAEALMKSISQLYSGRNIHFIISALADKETKKMVDLYSSIAKSITFTEFDYYRIKKAIDLYNECNHLVKYIEIDTKTAIFNTIENVDENDCVIITGSLYFISLIRHYFFE